MKPDKAFGSILVGLGLLLAVAPLAAMPSQEPPEGEPTQVEGEPPQETEGAAGEESDAEGNEEEEEEPPFATLIVTSDSPCLVYVNGAYVGAITDIEEPLEVGLEEASVDLSAASTEVNGARFTEGEKGVFEVEAGEVREISVPLLEAIEDFQLKQRRERTWIDLDRGLMWAKQDNGSDISWSRALDFCDEYALGGFEDWRLPDVSELEALEAMWSVRQHKIVDSIFLSGCCTWSSTETDEGTAYNVDFRYRRRFESNPNLSYGLRALCARTLSAEELALAQLLADPKEQKRRLKEKRKRQDEKRQRKAERAARRAAKESGDEPDMPPQR